MPTEFTTNIREIAAELKGMDKVFAAGIRRAIREVVTTAGEATTNAIKAHALENGLHQASAATAMKVSFAVRSGGARIATNQRKARYARPLEQGSKGAGGGINRHPVFGGPGTKHLNAPYVNQPTRPFFFGTAQAEEPLSEALLIARVDAAVAFAGFHG